MKERLVRLVHGLGVVLMLAVPSLVSADSRPRNATADLPLWRTECGSCHVAYPPHLLTAPDWKAVMAALDRHYGTDASLAPEGVAAISAYLERNAGGQRVASSAAPPQITTSRWFKREHREVASATWLRPSIRTPANCGACHPKADGGDFDEHSIRIPR